MRGATAPRYPICLALQTPLMPTRGLQQHASSHCHLQLLVHLSEQGLSRSPGYAAAVPGVDLLFIGPNDLALSLLGYTPAKGHEPEFVAALDDVVAAARRHGKWLGRLVNNGEAAKEARSRFDMVVMAHDTVAMQNWYRGEIAAAQRK